MTARTRRAVRDLRIRMELAKQARPQLPECPRASLHAILATEARRPLAGKGKPLDHTSLFGDSHLQREMFQ